MKIRTIFGIAFIAILISCQLFKKKDNSPEFVAKTFLVHIQKLEFEDAKEYATEETKMMLTFFTNISDLVPDSQRVSATEPDVEIHDCIIQNETAQCSYTANHKDQTIDLIKQDGKWLVDMKKEDAKPDYFKESK